MMWLGVALPKILSIFFSLSIFCVPKMLEGEKTIVCMLYNV